METKSYNPKTSTVVDRYVVNTTGDRYFIHSYPDPEGTMSQQLTQTQKLSPTGVEQLTS